MLCNVHYEIKVTICGRACKKLQAGMASGQQQLFLLIDKNKSSFHLKSFIEETSCKGGKLQCEK